MLNVLGETIRKYRKLKDYSTQYLANKLNISVGLLNNIENGRTDAFQLGLLNKIIDELEIPLSEIKIVSDISYAPQVQSFEDSIVIEVQSCVQLDDLTCKYLKSIIKAYLNTLKFYNFDESKIKLLSEHLLNELSFSKSLGDRPTK